MKAAQQVRWWRSMTKELMMQEGVKPWSVCALERQWMWAWEVARCEETGAPLGDVAAWQDVIWQHTLRAVRGTDIGAGRRPGHPTRWEQNVFDFATAQGHDFWKRWARSMDRHSWRGYRKAFANYVMKKAGAMVGGLEASYA